MNSSTNKTSDPIPGYEDIHSNEPYINVDHSSSNSKCCYIDMIYVPPHLRGQGIGKKLVLDFIENELESNKERIRLISCDLGSGDSKKFWEEFGFKQAYYGNTDSEWGELKDIMVLGVNGHYTPKPEKLTSRNNDREMHECEEDLRHIHKNNSAELTY